MKRNLQPLAAADIPTFEEWLSNTPYPASRKAELQRTWDAANREISDKDLHKVKGFIKDETYPTWKFCRLINSRIDAAKCLFGPEVQAVSDIVFKNPFFIKKIPVSERPVVIRDALLKQSGDYSFTDYTSYEAHFTKEIMAVTQVMLFRFMLHDANRTEWLRQYELAMTGTNKISFRDVNVTLEATRMSGEMDTSLSNGFANLMTMLFLCHENGLVKDEQVRGFVEGDDGLFQCSPPHLTPTTKQFEEMGFTIKMEHTDKLSEASFCGQVYDMEDLAVVTDPLEVIARVGWTNKKYTRCNRKTALQLLRAKGYSLVFQYAGCPLLAVLGRRILELTEHIDVDDRIWNQMNWWEREKRRQWADKIPDVPVGSNTRALVARLYNISIQEQLDIEEFFRTIELQFYEMPALHAVDKTWIEYFDRYSHDRFEMDPAWLQMPEQGYLDRLAAIPNCKTFVNSL
jgi:hypothetical protein